MATTLLLWQDKSGDEQEPVGDKERPDVAAATAVAPARSKNRKSGKQAQNAPKKQPQRGLGVAQLERLRVQELRRKMLAEAGITFAPLGTVSPMSPLSGTAGTRQYAFPFPSDCLSGGGGAGAFMSPRLSPHPPHPTAGTGFCGFPRSVAYGMQRYGVGGCGGILASSEGLDHVSTGCQRFPNNAIPPGTPEMVKELPSNQNVLCCSDQCDSCIKRMRAQSSGQTYGVRQQGGSWTDGSDFLRLGLWSSGALHPERGAQETLKCGERNADLAMLTDEGMMLEKKGKDVLMEYEFFPSTKAKVVGGISVEKGDGETMMAMAELPSVSVPPSFASSSRHDPLDLSLTLSGYYYSC